MCALLNFPKGEIATRNPLPADNSLLTSKRRLWLGIKCSIGERTFAHVKNDCTKSQKDIKSCSQQFAVYSCQCSCLQRTKLCMTLFRWTERFETRANSGMASRATCPECYGFQLTGVPYVPLPAEIHHLSALSIFLV